LEETEGIEVSEADIADVVDDVRDFFLNPNHPIFTSRGTPSSIRPDSVYHVGQLEVLFEDRHFHFRTTRAVRRLREEGFLRGEQVAFDGNRVIVVWRRNLRYTKRSIQDHVRLVREYSSDAINKATGDYAEILTDLGLTKLRFEVVSRNSREYRGQRWDATEHDLDFIAERQGVAFGVEVKNTWPYFPPDELAIKLRLCAHLGLRPLFIARHRHSGQYEAVRNAGGLLYIFKSKVFPPGQEELVRRIWRQMRLPVIVWNEWRPQFYTTIQSFIDRLSAPQLQNTDQAITLNRGSET